jgi:hypothetical protein
MGEAIKYTKRETITKESWDRGCPEFQRRCDQYDENYPENNLTYFPTVEEWTLTPQPNRYQYAEKFPPRFGVSSIPQQSQYQHTRAPMPKVVHRQRRQPMLKPLPNQSTMDKFVTAGNSQRESGEIVYESDIGQEPQENAWD